MDAVAKARPATAKGRFISRVTLAATMTPGVELDASKYHQTAAA